jgi:hypothetical protein
MIYSIMVFLFSALPHDEGTKPGISNRLNAINLNMETPTVAESKKCPENFGRMMTSFLSIFISVENFS